MYFDPAVYQTAQLQLYYANSISRVGQYIKKLIIDTFELYPGETILKFGIADIYDELKSEIKTIERQKIQHSLEKELNMKQHSRTHYTLFSRKMAELNPHYFPTKNGQNKVHYVFNRFDAECWKNTSSIF